jgi:hypothetical protein
MQSAHVLQKVVKLAVGNVQASAKTDGDDLDRDPRSAFSRVQITKFWYDVR